MKDKTGKTIKAGDIISYNRGRFEVVKYAGFLGKKGELKAMEMKSMFEGVRDFWLEDLAGEEKKIKVLPPKIIKREKSKRKIKL